MGLNTPTREENLKDKARTKDTAQASSTSSTSQSTKNKSKQRVANLFLSVLIIGDDEPN